MITVTSLPEWNTTDLNLEKPSEKFNDKSTSDFVIEIDNQEIYLHKSILSLRSPYFKGMVKIHYLFNILLIFLIYLVFIWN